MALALSFAGAAPANTINIDNRPVSIAAAVTGSPSQRLLVAVEQDDAPAESFSWTIAGDYFQFEEGSAFLAAVDSLQAESDIQLSFEFTAGYAPDAGMVHTIRALMTGV